tara:strand:+ start:1256 stop:4030 length:2775 start_codon:yes stop_codon:yes gene_type:complete
MAKKKRKRSSYFPVKIPISSLSGGVGRQAPNKRLPNEAENLNNVFCTTERSIDKRNGFKLPSTGSKLDIPGGNDVWFYWYDAGDDRRFLIGINFNQNVSATEEDVLYVFKVEDDDTLIKQDVNPNIDQDIINYLTFGNKSSKETLKACAVGSSVLVLNTQVKAGFTSDGSLITFDNGTDEGIQGAVLKELDGTDFEDPSLIHEDKKGPPLEYETAASVDPLGRAEVFTEFTDFVQGQRTIDLTDKKSEWAGSGTTDTDDSRDDQRFGVWQVKSSVDTNNLPGPNYSNGTITAPSATSSRWERVKIEGATGTSITDYLWTDFIDPEDYVYPDPTKLYLGQAVSQFSQLKFPLSNLDIVANNGNDLVNRAFQELYPNDGDESGGGKLFFLSQAYLSSTPGYYRSVSTKSPYLSKVRTPDKMSVIDNRRMPMQVFLDTSVDPATEQPRNFWSIRKVDWDPRDSGSVTSNPGPSVFRDEKGNAKEVQLKAISFYRDRLFLATEDTLFSSRLGDFSNFFLANPANIIFSDPIDIKVSSNVFTPITFLKPFKDFLFLGTSGNTQYELIGSENQISPLSAEIAPTSFFPMTEDVEPLVMNNNLFFFSKNRLFIYFQRFEAAGQQAFELSRHVPDFLPDNFWNTTVSSAHNMIFAVAGSSPTNTILVYRNQITGEQITQNAFFTFTMSDDTQIYSIKALEDSLYAVTSVESKEGRVYEVQVLNLLQDDPEIARLDSRTQIDISSVVYDPETNKTKIRFIPNNFVVASSMNAVVINNTIYKKFIFEGVEDGEHEISVEGAVVGINNIVIGTTYNTEIELSTLFVRDERNNITPGTLNLRYGVFRHRNTGNYDVEVKRKNREGRVYNFAPVHLNETDSLEEGKTFEKDGIFKIPLLGFSDDIVIKISSDYPNPMNLTDIEITGKFKRVPKFLTT